MPESNASPMPALTPVSSELTKARLLSLLCCALPLGVGLGFAAFFVPVWLTALLAATLTVGIVWVGLVVLRQVRHIGYLQRDDDLLIARGVMFRTTTVVPYGRMQYVEVTSGPINRMFGLATVELHTASASSDASIPGMLRADAERLRDELAALGESRLAGL